MKGREGVWGSGVRGGGQSLVLPSVMFVAWLGDATQQSNKNHKHLPAA